ncbi:YjjG family noncanonical pyrimidine nucleotidase [Limibacter armeniacum]|uniref:YjjG family noncanonical pyrimidine nucleotidase n=1 Tax=Limibacter armeniacum TaxID=466084 RepID=UPI002FE5DBC6
MNLKRNTFKHLFFDLDHTLWDFERCSEETLEELYDIHRVDLLSKGSASKDHFIAAFRKINAELWSHYNESRITKETIRDRRFPMMFELLNIPAAVCPANLGKEYLERCPKKPYLIPDTIEALEHLQNKYYLHILTNGFADVQSTKMRYSNIFHYFNSVVTSECTGHKKPSKEIFEFAMKQAGAAADQSAMIGDNLNTDIVGANNAGMFSVYYNPDAVEHNEYVGAEIISLKELIELF